MANHFENMDQYFGGEMNAREMQHFENAVKQDPLLEKEFNFQQELVDGLQAARRAELKATLSNIDITGTTALESGVLTKILGGVAVAGMVTVGAYFYFGQEQALEAVDKVEQETIKTNEVVEETPVIEQIEQSTVEVVDETISEEASEMAVVEVDNNTKATASNNNIVISEAKVTEGFEDEEELSETEAPVNHLITKSKVNLSAMEVTVESSKKYSFHYQVKNNALSLYGDFSRLYDIIEFHKDGNTKTYLKYDEKYYEIDKQQSKATPLVELTGDSLHSLLDSIENNKER